MTQHLLIANPENRRVAFFQKALKRFGLPAARVIAYADLIDRPEMLHGLLGSQTILRIDSPGENNLVERKLIALGASLNGDGNHSSISAADALRLKPDRGRIRYSRQWYLGFQDLMRSILEHSPEKTRHYNHPADIQLMFDKPRCQAKLQASGVPTAPTLQSTCFDDIVREMHERRWKRVFIKPAHGSSASGVIALTCYQDRLLAVTTIESVPSGPEFHYYNNLNLQTYSDRNEVCRVVDFVCREGTQVEKWLPKLTMSSRNLDLRILVIGGRACQAVVRTSNSPITNLHLGNRRGDLEQFVQFVGTEAWEKIKAVAVQACRVFPKSLAVGVDVLVSPRTFCPIVLELNAFGDLLPRVQHDGMNAWESQVTCLLR